MPEALSSYRSYRGAHSQTYHAVILVLPIHISFTLTAIRGRSQNSIMNNAEVQIIKETWEIPIANPTDSGAAILVNFFTNYPSNLQKFASFKDTPVTELNSNPRFRAHASRIIRVFDESIKTLDQDDAATKLEEIWTNIATTHFKRQISKQSYNELKGAIIEVLTAACSLTDEQAAVWVKLLDTVYSIIFNAIDQLESA